MVGFGEYNRGFQLVWQLKFALPKAYILYWGRLWSERSYNRIIPRVNFLKRERPKIPISLADLFHTCLYWFYVCAYLVSLSLIEWRLPPPHPNRHYKASYHICLTLLKIPHSKIFIHHLIKIQRWQGHGPPPCNTIPVRSQGKWGQQESAYITYEMDHQRLPIYNT
ncbi:hypothetical protein QQP08_002915 [Theobroma cacao]|nr:hypothetical protein QQP08_002915 [Theobroma cacao]